MLVRSAVLAPDLPTADVTPRPTARLSLVGLWGIAGVVALLTQAILRLAPLAIEPARTGSLGLGHLAVLAAWIAVAGYAEGYRGFHQQFCPRVVARAQHLSAHPRRLHAILAPAFCMGLVHATRKRLIVSWSVSLGVIGLIVLVRQLAQPWRGIVDAGVVLALAWGALMLVYLAARALAGHRMSVPPDVPT